MRRYILTASLLLAFSWLTITGCMEAMAEDAASPASEMIGGGAAGGGGLAIVMGVSNATGGSDLVISDGDVIDATASTLTTGTEHSIVATPGSARSSDIMSITAASANWTGGSAVAIDTSADSGVAGITVNAASAGAVVYSGAAGAGTGWFNISGGRNRFQNDANIALGDFLDVRAGAGELRDTDGVQSMVKIALEIDQDSAPATACWYGVNIDPVLTGEGDGSTGDGNAALHIDFPSGYAGGATGAAGAAFMLWGGVNGSTRGYWGSDGSIYANAPSGFTGDVIHLAVNGTRVFDVDEAGDGAFGGNLSTDRLSVNASDAIWFGGYDSYGAFYTSSDDGLKFLAGYGNGTGNRNIIVSDGANRNKDHDHDTLSPDPTVFFHSITDPDVSNQEWGSLTHDGADFVLDTGGQAAGTGSAPTTITNRVRVDAPFETAGAVFYNETAIAAATYDLAATDYYLNCDYTATAAITSLTLPTAQMVAGRTIHIIDTGGNASAANITVDTEGAETISGSATAVISADYGSLSLKATASGWFIF